MKAGGYFKCGACNLLVYNSSEKGEIGMLNRKFLRPNVPVL